MRNVITKWSAVTISVVSMALALTACGNRPSDMKTMSNNLSEVISETSITGVSLDGAIVDTSLGFDPAIKRAVETHESYQAARSLEQEMINRVGVAKSVQRPQVTGSSTFGGIFEHGGQQPDTATAGIATGINISQLIYDGGESTSNVNQATAEALAARAELALLGNSLALEAAEAWIDVWRYGEQLALLRKRASEMGTLVEQIERMASNGLSDRAALDSARRQIVDITLEETRLQADLHQAEVRFTRFFKKQSTPLPPPAELVNLTMAQTYATNWQQAPSLVLSAAKVMVARSSAAGVEASFKPKARLQAGINSPMQDGESTEARLGLMFEYTFGDGGRREAQLEAAEARVEALETQLSDAQRTLEAEIDAALQQLTAINESMPLVKQQIALSASEAQTAQSQLATGQSNLRQVVEAKIENYRAEDRQIAMRAEKLMLQLSISARTGALGPLIGLKP